MIRNDKYESCSIIIAILLQLWKISASIVLSFNFIRLQLRKVIRASFLPPLMNRYVICISSLCIYAFLHFFMYGYKNVLWSRHTRLSSVAAHVRSLQLLSPSEAIS